MKINDLRESSKDDILAALGLTTKPTASERLFAGLGVFGIGVLVGASAALLLAPKSGQALRAALGEKLRDRRQEEAEPSEQPPADAPDAEAHT